MTARSKTGFVLVLSLLLLVSVAQAGELRLRDGETVDGKGLRYRSGTFRVGETLLSREKVRSIRFVEGKAVAGGKALAAEGMTPEALRALAAYSKNWPGVDGVILLDESVHRLRADGSRTIRHHLVAHVLKDERKSWGRRSITFEPGRERVRILVAQAANPDGSHHVLDPKDVKISVPSGGFSHFQKSREMASFVLPGVEKGSVVEITYERDEYRPSTPEFFFPRFGFQSSVPCRLARFVVEGPRELDLKWKTVAVPAKQAEPVVATDGDLRRWTWTMEDVPPLIAEPSMPDYWDAAPSVRCSNIADWEPFFAWARKMIAGKVERTPEIEAKAAEIVAGCEGDEAKAAALYHWMQREIRYISVKSSTSSGYAGHAASLTLKNKFGDCIDKAILFASFLQAVGIAARPVIVNTNSSFATDPSLPGWQSNHAITQLVLGGETRYLDSTASSYRYPSFRRDDQGILCFNLDDGRFDPIPLPAPEAHLFGLDFDLVLDDEGAGKLTTRYLLNGAYEASHRGYWKGVKEEERRKVMQRIVAGFSPGARLVDFHVDGEYDLATPLKVGFIATLPDYLSEAGPLRIVELPKVRRSFGEAGLPKRKYAIEYRSTQHDEVRVRMRWPATRYALHHAPESLRLSTKWADFEGVYEKAGPGRLDYRQVFRRKVRVVPAADYPAYRDFLTRVARFTEERVFLAVREAGGGRDLLVLSDGREIKGALEAIGPSSLRFRSEKGETLEAPLSDAVRLDLGESRGEAKKTLESLDDPLLAGLVKAAPGEKEYPGAGSLTLLHEVRVELGEDGSSVEETRWIEKVLKERGKGAGNYAGSYRRDEERHTVLHGRSIAPDGTVHVLDDSSIQESASYASFPAYDVVQRLKLALPEVNPGTVTDLAVRHEVKRHELFRPFYHEFSFQGGEPILEKRITVIVPEKTPLVWKVLNGEGIVETEEKRVGGKRILVFRARDVPARKQENYTPPSRDYLPWLVLGVHRPWADIARAWEAEAKKVVEASWSVPDELAALMKGDGADRARKLYGWVARNVTLAGVGLGAVGWRPRAPGAILADRYGNYLDKPFLFWALLRRAGIPAEFHLCCDQNMGRLVEEIGSLGQCNDALIRMPGGRFVNPERDYAPMDTLYEDFQGCRSLCVFGGEAGLVPVPLRGVDEEQERKSQVVELAADGSVRVTRHVRPLGTQQYEARRLKRLKEEELRKRLQNAVHGIHPQARLVSYRYEDLDRLEKELDLELVYAVEDYCLRAGKGTLALRLPGLSYSAESVGKEERLHPLYWWSLYGETRRIELKIPAGWFVRHLPEPLVYEDEDFRFTGRFRREGTGLVYEGRYERRSRSLPKEAWPRFRKLLETRARASKAWIVVERFDG